MYTKRQAFDAYFNMSKDSSVEGAQTTERMESDSMNQYSQKPLIRLNLTQFGNSNAKFPKGFKTSKVKDSTDGSLYQSNAGTNEGDTM